MGSRLPGLGTGPILLVVITPTWGIFLNMLSIIGLAVETIPEGMVKGPDRDLPKNSVFKVLASQLEKTAVTIPWLEIIFSQICEDQREIQKKAGQLSDL
jgi:hypothetical protein